jgi:hypothetical protein
MKRSTRRRAFVGVVTFAAFLWTLTLGVSPQFHKRIHPDANRVDHSCAVTIIASGKYSHSSAAPLISAPTLIDQFSPSPTLTPHWIESSFLLARVFEHAPPAHS